VKVATLHRSDFVQQNAANTKTNTWDLTSLTRNLHRIFFECPETIFWNEDSEINGIPDNIATLHKNDFIKQNAANHKLTNSHFGHSVTEITSPV
jgi:hypothetical protein